MKAHKILGIILVILYINYLFIFNTYKINNCQSAIITLNIIIMYFDPIKATFCYRIIEGKNTHD